MSNFHSDLRGVDLHSPSNELVENNSGASISIFKAIKFTSIGSAYPQIELATGSTDIVRGITAETISNGGIGYVCSLGFLNGVDTSPWVAGTRLYAAAGGIIGSSPVGLPIGTVLRQNAINGVVYVDNTGITQGDLDNLTFPPAAQIELGWNILYPSSHKVFVYDGMNRITDINVYDSPSCGLLLFNKNLSYSGNKISNIVVTSFIPSGTLTKSLSYSGDLVQSVTVTSSYG